MSKKQFFKSPFIIAAFCCFVIAGATLVFFPQTQSTAVKGITQKIAPTITSKQTQFTTPTTSIQKQTQTATPAQNNAIQISPTVTAEDHASQTEASTPQPTTEQKTKNIQQTLRVKLSINGSSVGTVEIPEGANQCDVLTRAKDQGKIASLLMKFDTSLETNGVYQINGVGKENTVWWVYNVNGKSPAQGCSYIKANNDDEVAWEYKG